MKSNTIASCAYYICDSNMLHELDRLSTMNARERHSHLGQGWRKYHLSKTFKNNGETITLIGYDEMELSVPAPRIINPPGH